MDSQHIIKQADKCVYCGLCSAVCPTYSLTSNEVESPRGRVVAMAQFALGKLEAESRFIEQINNCLLCGSCEQMCPAGVPITNIIKQTKKLLPLDKSVKKYRWALLNSHNLKWAFKIQSKLIKPWNNNHNNYKSLNKPNSDEISDLGLFIGCTGNSFDQDTVSACQELLTKLNIKFKIPKGQQCCGSLHHNQGDYANFKKLQSKNSQTIQNSHIKKYIYFTSGCNKAMKMLANDNNIISYESIDYFNNLDLSKLKFTPLDQTVLLHLPCTAKDDSDIFRKISKLLSNIPKLKLQLITGCGSCCGAAGTYKYSHSNRANTLRTPFVNFINQSFSTHPKTSPNTMNLLLTTNIGCKMHLADGLDLKDVRIMHPIFLLNQQLC